jgi:hypothetical protein
LTSENGTKLPIRNVRLRPRWYDSEQFNYVLEGEIWFFIGEAGFRSRREL